MRRQWLVALVVMLTAAGVTALALFVLPAMAVPADATLRSDPVLPATPAASGPAHISGPITVSLTADLAWYLPPGWRATTLGTAAGSGLSVANGDKLLAAWQGASRFEDAAVRFTVSRTPRHKLGLAQYASAAARGLAEKGYGVTQTVVTTTLRADGLPVSAIEFQNGNTRGYQVAAFDATGEQLLFLTLAAPAGEYEARLRDFLAMIRDATRE
jgi:hypothetical protein